MSAIDNLMDLETKKANVTEKLQKREEERLADLQKRKDEKESTTATNENADYFTENFNKFKNELEANINKSNDLSKDKLAEHFDSMSVALQNMQKFVTDSTMFLAPYEVQKSQEMITKLQNEIQMKRDEMIPKKKFAFKGKKKAATIAKEEPKVTKEASKELSIDMVDCSFANKEEQNLFMCAEEINNKDIALAKLQNCTVKLEGSPSAIHINNLKNCKVFSGPVSGSIFIDDCVDCTFVLPCQQLRIHSTTKTHFYIHVTSKAIIEDCNNVEFAPYNWDYDRLDMHYKISGLDKNRNNWDDVDDFNWLASDKKSPNWKVLDEKMRVTVWNVK